MKVLELISILINYKALNQSVYISSQIIQTIWTHSQLTIETIQYPHFHALQLVYAYLHMTD
jgi:hypothetical protein